MKKIILILIALTGLFAMTQKAKVLDIEGEIGVYGNMPHSFVAIKDFNGTLYKIDNADDFNLLYKQNQIVELKAVLLKDSTSPIELKEIEVLEIVK